MDKFQHDPWGAPFSTNLTPIFVYFTGLSWLIATFFTVTACSKGGRVSWTIRSIWIRSVVSLKCVKGFPFLCCGYFKPSTLGYKLYEIILSSTDSGASGEERRSKIVEKWILLSFVVVVSLQKMLNQFSGVLNAPWAAKSRVCFERNEVTAKEVGQPRWSLKFIESVIIMGLIMERVTINPPVSPYRLIVLQSQSSNRPTTATMTSCCGRCKACSGDRAGGFWEGLRASPGEPYSAAIRWTPGRTLMWPGSGFSGFTLFGLFKNKLLLERDCENRSVRDSAFPQEHLKKKKGNHLVYEKKESWWEKRFFVFFSFLELWCMRWERGKA